MRKARRRRRNGPPPPPSSSSATERRPWPHYATIPLSTAQRTRKTYIYSPSRRCRRCATRVHARARVCTVVVYYYMYVMGVCILYRHARARTKHPRASRASQRVSFLTPSARVSRT